MLLRAAQSQVSAVRLTRQKKLKKLLTVPAAARTAVLEISDTLAL